MQTIAHTHTGVCMKVISRNQGHAMLKMLSKFIKDFVLVVTKQCLIAYEIIRNTNKIDFYP